MVASTPASSPLPASSMGQPLEPNLSELEAATQRLLKILAATDAKMIGPRAKGLRVRLATKPGALLVLVEQDDVDPLDTSTLLPILESALRTLLAELPFPDTLGHRLAERQQIPVRLFLRYLGHDRPYKNHRFTWQASDALAEVFGESPQPPDKQPQGDLSPPHPTHRDLGDSASPAGPTQSPPAAAPVTRVIPPEAAPEATVEAAAPPDPFTETTAIAPFVHPLPPDHPPKHDDDALNNDALNNDLGAELMPLDEDDWAAEPVALTFQPIALQPGWITRLDTWKQRAVSLPPWVWGAVVGVFALSGAGYALSRPCVLGPCLRLTEAETLTQTALDSLAAQPAPGEVAAAYDQMQTATQLLIPIPRWSPHYGTAQAVLADYETDAIALEQVVTAQQSATEAAAKSQNPPHPMPRWVEVRLLWQQAIAQLQQLPGESPVQSFATEKLREYQANLAQIDGRITAEQTAEENLSQGLQTGQLAIHHTENAASAPSWQLAYREWENAVNFLQQIPQGTQAYSQAQALLQEYRGHLQSARDRVQNEQLGDRAYAQAISAAQQARQYEQQNQWTLAVQQWRQALAFAEQVPRATAVASSAQALLDPYRNALGHATSQLREAIALQKLSDDLDQICSPDALVCRYTVAGTQLRITVNPGYDQALVETMTRQPTASDATFAAPARQLLQHIANLGQHNQRMIELYDAQGVLLARYVPQYGGFIRQ